MSKERELFLDALVARQHAALKLAVPMMEEAQDALFGNDDVCIVEGEDGLRRALDAARDAIAEVNELSLLTDEDY